MLVKKEEVSIAVNARNKEIGGGGGEREFPLGTDVRLTVGIYSDQACLGIARPGKLKRKKPSGAPKKKSGFAVTASGHVGIQKPGAGKGKDRGGCPKEQRAERGQEGESDGTRRRKGDPLYPKASREFPGL